MAVCSTFKHSDLSSPITEIALGLAALKDGQYYPSGTAVIVGPHLAMTACHVVEDYWNQFETKKNLEGQCDGTFNMLAFQVKQNGRAGAIWSVGKVFLSNVTDIAFLYLVPHIVKKKDYRWIAPKIDLVPPQKGTRVSCFGYHRPKINQLGDVVNWSVNPFTACGEIMDVFEKRQGSLRPFPCFRTNARFDPSMSGGPVFNEEGKLCGIICSGMNLEKPEEDPISYASLLWPSMLTKIDLDREGFQKNIKYWALELARHGHIIANGWEKIEIFESGNINATIQIKLSKKE